MSEEGLMGLSLGLGFMAVVSDGGGWGLGFRV